MPVSPLEPVSPIDITKANKYSNPVGIVFQVTDVDNDSKPLAATTSFNRSNSSDSATGSVSSPRKARFAEATSVCSPAVGPGEKRAPFSDPPKMAENINKPSDIGFGYIADNQPVEQHAEVRSELHPTTGLPLKSALKSPGTARLNPLSPTFREEQMLEKHEESTEKEQAKDLKIKTRVRMAKMVLRGVNFSCSLIVLAMLSTVLTIFNATKFLPPRNNLQAWAPNTRLWPQLVVLAIACLSLIFSVVVIAAYCCGGHRRAEKVAVYYTMFAVGWFMFSVIMWVVGAGILQGSRANGQGQDLWGWSCKDNKRRTLFQDDVHYALVCRLQDWALVCCIIEVVVEVIVIAIYGVVFYRFYSKNRLRKSMDARDKARSDLYLAQLRSQSAPNTPGFAMSPRNPYFNKNNKDDDDEDDSPVQYSPPSAHSAQGGAFKLQAPPQKTPKVSQAESFEPQRTTTPPAARVNEHVTAAPGEVVYDAVPIPGAYAQHKNV